MGFFVPRSTEAIEAFQYLLDGSNCVEIMQWLGAGEHEPDSGDCGKNPIFFDFDGKLLPGEWAVKLSWSSSFITKTNKDFQKEYLDVSNSWYEVSVSEVSNT